MGLTLGYKASAEQFGPRELLDFSVRAEQLGLDSIAVSDHFQPWRHSTGHAPNSIAWLGALGQATERALLMTSVLTPTFRLHPSIVAQSFGTLGVLFPERVILGIGTGEAMNETPATGLEWPGAKERRLRLAESVELMRQLWTEDRVSFEGDYYVTDRATIYDKPEKPVPIYIAAWAPLATKYAGRAGDGFICTSGKDPDAYIERKANLEEGATSAGRDPSAIEKVIEIKVAYDHDVAYAKDSCRWWAALSLSAEEKSGVEDAVEMERLADAAADRAHGRFIVSDDADDVVEQIGTYVDLGFKHLVFHAPGADQERFLKQFCADVVPKLREKW